MENKKNFIIGGSILGVLMLSLIISLAYIAHYKDNHRNPPQVLTGIGDIAKFKDEAEFQNYILKNQKARDAGNYGGFLNDFGMGGEMDSASESALQEPAQTKDEARYSETNVQVLSIDEPDILKTDGKYIYYNQSDYGVDGGVKPMNEVVPSNSSNSDKGEQSSPGSASNEDEASSRTDDSSSSPQTTPTQDQTSDMMPTEPDMMPYYPIPNKLNIIQATPIDEMKVLSREDIGYGELLLVDNIVISHEGNEINAINVEVPEKPVTEWNKKYADGVQISHTRLYNGDLYIVTQKYIYREMPCDIIMYSENTTDHKIMCTDIYYPSDVDNSDEIITVTKINPSNGAVIAETSFVGDNSYSTIYMSENALYITYPNWNYWDYSGRGESPENLDELETTAIVKIDNDDLKIIEQGVVPGTLLNQFSLDEHEGFLRVATTEGQNWWFMRDAIETNSIYVLDDKLDLVGSVQDLGLDERIYSARFVGDTGYLVTFKQIDPFYVIDLSDPTDPQVTGELKIPGYSSYLHPIERDIILGVGREESSVKLSLFDVSDPSNPVEADKLIIKNSWSEVEGNHHAFMIDTDNGYFFIPTSEGGKIVSYKNNNLTLLKDVGDQTVKRALFINDYLYIVGDKKVEVIAISNWDKVNELEL